MLNLPMGYVVGLHLASHENLRVITIRTKQTNYKGYSMGNIYFSGRIRHSILCLTTASFLSGSVCAPLLASPPVAKGGINIDLNGIAFGIRIEKLIERIKKYKDALNSGKMMEVMFELKTEIEAYTRRKIDIDSHIDAIEKEAKKQGAKFKSGEVKQIKKDLKKKGKKSSHKAMWLYNCNEAGIDFEQELCDLDFEAQQFDHNFYMAKHSKGHGKEDEKEVKVPIRVSIGITASLCGYFLSFIPHPYAQTASKFLIATGVGLCVDGTVNRLEEDEKKEQEGK